MKLFKEKNITLKLNNKYLDEADDFICQAMTQANISDVSINECRMIFEEIFSRVADEDEDMARDVQISVRKAFGRMEIGISFLGRRAVFDLDKNGIDDPGILILARFRDRLGFSYRRGTNIVRISVQESNMKKSIAYCAAFLMAITVAGIMIAVLSTDQKDYVITCVVMPVEKLFGNALLLLSTPLVMLSMIRNITTVWSYTDTNLKIRKTIGRVIMLSVYTAVAGALAFCFFVYVLIGEEKAFNRFKPENAMDFSWLYEMIKNAIPPNILELFSAETSLPLLLFSVVLAAAICCSGKYFDLLKTLFDAIYVVFSKMLSMVMVLLPVALFFALLNDSLENDLMTSLRKMLVLFSFGVMGLVILCLFLFIRIGIKGVSPVSVIKKIKHAIPANLRIGSTINAVPFNTRYCVRKIGIDISRLETTLPIMAQISQSGNCFFLTFLPLCILMWQGVYITVPVVITVAVLSIILSIGAPGQPGTIMIGMLVIMSLLELNTIDYMYAIIYMEVLFGWAMTLINTISDLCEVTSDYMVEVKKERIA